MNELGDAQSQHLKCAKDRRGNDGNYIRTEIRDFIDSAHGAVAMREMLVEGQGNFDR
jgi:hypothetical protein